MDHAEGQIHGQLHDRCFTIQMPKVDEPIVRDIKVVLPPKARRLYDQMEREFFVQLGNKEVEAANAAVKSQRLLQMASGALYTDEQKNWEPIHHEKIAALEDLVEELAGKPVIIAYHFKSDLARLKKVYPQGRELDKNQKTIDDWNAGKIPVLFAHPMSAGHGLNLANGGHVLIFFSNDWSLENYLQIIERIGQRRQRSAGFDRPTYVYRIVAKDTVDELVLERLESRRSVHEVLLEAMTRRLRHGAPLRTEEKLRLILGDGVALGC